MSLKQRNDGSWLIESAKDLQEVAEAIEVRESAVAEMEQAMEETHDYLTIKREIEELNATMVSFMASKDVAHVFRDDYKITLVKRSTGSWNASKLKALVPKPLWLKITKQVVDPEKIDDLVKKGSLDRKKIAPAFEQKSQQPHIRRYPYKEGQNREAAMAEEDALRKAMAGEAAEKSASKRK